MCRIERFRIVHPDGFQEPGVSLQHCERGTPNRSCDNPIIIETGRVVAGQAAPPPPPPPPPPPHIQVVEPRERDRRRPPESTKRRSGFSDHLRVVFKFSNPFCSRREKTSKHPKGVFVRRRRGGQQHPEPEQERYYPTPQPPPPPPPPPPPVAQGPIYPPFGQTHHPSHPRESGDMRRGRAPRDPIEILEFRDERNSPPLISPNRQHHRPRARTLSPNGRYQEQKRERDRARREEELWRVQQNQLYYEAELDRRRQAQREAERARQEAQREAARARQEAQREAARQARRQAQREEAERHARRQARREAEQVRQEAQREAERQARRQARREAEREQRRERARQREAEERERRDAEERARRARLTRARIPPQPRHEPVLNQHIRGRGSLDDRGEQVLDDAVREAERNRLFRGWYRRPDVGGLGRRRTVGERWVDDGDRWRNGRRHWI